MKFFARSLFLALLLLASVPLPAQILMAAMRTQGLSCGFCTALSEYNFRHIPGVQKVDISLSKEIIVISYGSSNVRFDPEAIRKVLKPWNVKVLQFQIRARGRIYHHESQRLFRTGSDVFRIPAAQNTSVVPDDSLIEVEGILNDRFSPKELRILTYKVISP